MKSFFFINQFHLAARELRYLLGFALALFQSVGQLSADTVETFENSESLKRWTYGNAASYVGAGGGLTWANDGTDFFLRLSYDFTPPNPKPDNYKPSYVVAARSFTDAETKDATAVSVDYTLTDPFPSFWIRLVDNTGQTFQGPMIIAFETCHQKWQRGSVPIDGAYFGEHWGGANDGTFHPPLRKVGLCMPARPTSTLAASALIRGIRIHQGPLEISPGAGELIPDAGRPIVKDPRHFLGMVARNEKELREVAKLGLSWTRLDLSYSAVITEAGYNFSWYDSYVTLANQLGITPILILYAGSKFPGGSPPITDEGRVAFAEFAAACAVHFKAQNVAFEVWNEEDNPWFWKGAPDLANYGKLLSFTAKYVKGASPQTILIPGGINTAPEGQRLFFKNPDIDEGLTYCDAIAIHPYGPPENQIRRIRIGLEDASVTKTKDLWVTEWGFSSTQYSNTSNGHELEAKALQGANLLRSIIVSWFIGVRVNIIYQLRDEGINPLQAEQNYGILQNDYKPKPAKRYLETLLTFSGRHRFTGMRRSSDQPSFVHDAEFCDETTTQHLLWTECLNGEIAVAHNPRQGKIANIEGSFLAETFHDDAPDPIKITDRPTYLEVRKK